MSEKDIRNRYGTKHSIVEEHPILGTLLDGIGQEGLPDPEMKVKTIKENNDQLKESLIDENGELKKETR